MSSLTKACLELSNSLKGLRLSRSSEPPSPTQPTDDVTEESPNIAITSATLEEAPVTEIREVEAPAADDVAVQDGVGVGVVVGGVEETLGEGVESSTVEEDIQTLTV